MFVDLLDSRQDHATVTAKHKGRTRMMTGSFPSLPYKHIQRPDGQGWRYPFFTHHDSVSALWEQKWRGPCAAGIYPFGDGQVDDFDPIFAQLATISGDDSSVFDRPDDYAAPFLPVGERLHEEADAALAQGDAGLARRLYLRAAAVYRIARFPINRSPIGEEAWRRGKAAYEQGAALLDPPSRPVQIPFTHADVGAGDRQEPIHAYFRVPAGDVPGKGWPLVLFICGLDSYRTDNNSRIQAHLDHGFATLIFEIPGTGDCPAAPNDPTASDRLLDSIFEWVDASASTLSLDLDRIVARAISTGGYYAFRASHTHRHRLLAVAEQGGGCHHMFDPDWIAAQNQMEYPFALANALAWKFGYRDADPAAALARYTNEASKFSLLNAGIFDQPSCRLLVLNGTEDSIFPIEDSLIAALHGSNKDLIARANLPHMGNPGGEDLLYLWLDWVIAGEPGSFKGWTFQ